MKHLQTCAAIAVAFVASLTCGCGSHTAPPDALDLIIERGRIVDGTGNPWFRGDVGIRADRIVKIGDLSRARATRRIDARDKIVAPGFIDMHSHASWNYLVDSRVASKLTQGITLEIEGEGYSVAPANDAMVDRRRGALRKFGVEPNWRTLKQFFETLKAHPATINFASYLGTANVRELTVGLEDRPATPAELEKMRQITATAMEEGALGVYSALMYSPDRYNRTEELIEMAKVAAKYGGIYQTHPRSESNAVMDSLREIARIARAAQIPVHVTHIKVTYQQNWGRMPEVVDFIERMRAEGLDITADLYPYVRAGGEFTPLLPPWVQDGGRQSIVRRLSDPVTRERIKQELARPGNDWENEYYGAGGGPQGITLADARAISELKPFVGHTIAEIAKLQRKDPRDVVLDIVLAGDAPMHVHITDENDMRYVMQRPWVAFGTDGQSVAPDGPLSRELVHPRSYGAFPRIFATYVRDLRLLRLEDAVRKATSLPAQRLRIRDRGLLREGFFADIVILDPQTIQDTATFELPHQFANGIDYVVVNGTVVLDNGKITDARPGRVVYGPGYKNAS